MMFFPAQADWFFFFFGKEPFGFPIEVFCMLCFRSEGRNLPGCESEKFLVAKGGDAIFFKILFPRLRNLRLIFSR